MPNRYLGRDLANQRYLGRDVISIRSFGRIIFPTGPATRLSVANSMATTGVVAFQNSPIPGTGRYAPADALTFSTASILQPGEAFTGLVRVYVADANVDITAPLPSNVLIWSSANNWAILDVTAQASLGSAHYYTGSLNASVGLVRTDAQVYIGNASEWPAIDDGTLAGIHQEIFITGVNITTNTPTVAVGEMYTTISNLEPVGANELAPFSYEYFLNTTSLGTRAFPNLTLASPTPSTVLIRLVVRDANGTTFNSNTLTFTIT